MLPRAGDKINWNRPYAIFASLVCSLIITGCSTTSAPVETFASTRSAAMPMGRAVAPPPGLLSLCLRSPETCRTDGGGLAMSLNETLPVEEYYTGGVVSVQDSSASLRTVLSNAPADRPPMLSSDVSLRGRHISTSEMEQSFVLTDVTENVIRPLEYMRKGIMLQLPDRKPDEVRRMESFEFQSPVTWAALDLSNHTSMGASLRTAIAEGYIFSEGAEDSLQAGNFPQRILQSRSDAIHRSTFSDVSQNAVAPTDRSEPVIERIVSLETAARTSRSRAGDQTDTKIQYSQDLMRMLAALNRDINHAIVPTTDKIAFGRNEYWTLPLSFGQGDKGDCEDYALEKRAALLEAGIPAEAMYLAVGHSRLTGQHSVLVVSTSRGDYVLDSVDQSIRLWNDTRYHWVSRQVDANPLHWAQVS